MTGKLFTDEFSELDWPTLSSQIRAATTSDVRQALVRAGHGSLDDFAAMLSPAAAPFLEEMAHLAQELTRKRFGRTIQMYVPLYLSNECTNNCSYCGFSKENAIARLTLDREAVQREVEVIRNMGFEHLLLVTGEAPGHVGMDYFEKALDWVRPHFSSISMEVQPLETTEYARLMRKGLSSVYVYQETYHHETYATVHTRGKKTRFDYRLDTPDRLGAAGIRKMGLGVLLGLVEDWRTDTLFCAAHLLSLRKRWWKTRFSISFPRLRPNAGCFEPAVDLDQRQFLQLILAWRLLDENLELSLSTREPARFRDHVLGLGITQLSAGSRTDPGGYASDAEALEQFEIDDARSPAEVANAVRAAGCEVVWKDWDPVLDR